jgi:hypothetical protein
MKLYPADLHDPLELFYNHSNKIYHSGFCYVLSYLDKTSLVLKGGWVKWWVELRGECLWMWMVADSIAELTYKPEPMVAQIMGVELMTSGDIVGMVKMAAGEPVVLNISDGVVDMLPRSTRCMHLVLII